MSGEPVWILHDGKIGLRNQAMGVAEAVGLPFAEKRLSIRYPWRAMPPILWAAALLAPGRDGDRLVPPWPRLVIGAGGRSAAPALAIRRAAGGQCLAVQIQDPKLPPSRFDLMIVPAHDRVRGPHVMVSQGAVHRVTRAKLDEAAASFGPRLAHLPEPRVAVLVGGDNGHYRMSLDAVRVFADQLAALAAGGAGLMVTTSRRTGAPAEAVLKDVLSGPGVDIWDGTGDNPYFGYLGLADHIVTTADSISMITEAGATGKPVHIIPLDGGSPKFERFHQEMAKAGITRPFAGRLDDWHYPARDDTAEAGQRIRRMMQERGLWP